MGGGYPPEYPADNPRSWRNECEPAAERLAVLLAKWRENYENLNWIGFPRAGWPNIWDEEDEGFKVGACLSHGAKFHQSLRGASLIFMIPRGCRTLCEATAGRMASSEMNAKRR